jgi:hypothetical protein
MIIIGGGGKNKITAAPEVSKFRTNLTHSTTKGLSISSYTVYLQ